AIRSQLIAVERLAHVGGRPREVLPDERRVVVVEKAHVGRPRGGGAEHEQCEADRCMENGLQNGLLLHVGVLVRNHLCFSYGKVVVVVGKRKLWFAKKTSLVAVAAIHWSIMGWFSFRQNTPPRQSRRAPVRRPRRPGRSLSRLFCMQASGGAESMRRADARS